MRRSVQTRDGVHEKRAVASRRRDARHDKKSRRGNNESGWLVGRGVGVFFAFFDDCFHDDSIFPVPLHLGTSKATGVNQPLTANLLPAGVGVPAWV